MSINARREKGTFFFSVEYQKNLQTMMRKNKLGPYSDEHKKRLKEMAKRRRLFPSFGGNVWETSRQAAKETGIPASTIRYRCRNKSKGWSWAKEKDNHETV